MKLSRLSTWIIGMAAVIALPAPTAVQAQITAPKPVPVETPQLQPIPASEITVRAEQARMLVRDILGRLNAEPDTTDLEKVLPITAQRLAELASETEGLLSGRPGVSVLADFKTRWNAESEKLLKLQAQVMGQIRRLNADLVQLGAEVESWSLAAAQPAATRWPATLSEGVAATRRNLTAAEQQLTQRQSDLLSLQSRLSDLQFRCEQNLESIARAQSRSVLEFDSLPLWTALRQDQLKVELTSKLAESIRQKSSSVERYLREEHRRVVTQIFFFIGLLFVLFVLKRHSRRWQEHASFSHTTARVLGRPISAAFLVTILLTGIFHPHAPQAWISLAVLLGTIPLVRLLRGLSQIRVRNAIYVLALYFLMHLFVGQLSYWTLAGRLALLLLSFLVAASLAIEIRLIGRMQASTQGQWNGVLRLLRVLMAAAILSLVGNVLGSVSLADLLIDGVLTALYLAFVMQAAVLVCRGLVDAILATDTIRCLHMVSTHHALVRGRLDRGLNWLGAIAWLSATLAGFSILQPILVYARMVVTREFGFGHLSLTLGDIISFVLVIWFSLIVSRFIRFVLGEEVLPRFSMARGVPSTVLRLTHYSILAVGFLLAISAAGFGLDRLTILAGAFGLGIGFGLQDVVKNFVSGLILLFERPIKIGDQVQFGDMGGEVTGIGIRASTLRTWEGADVIVPNGMLTANQLVNWTYDDPKRRVDVNVGVSYASDPKQVLDLLLGVAADHPDIIRDPAPIALFVAFGDNSLNFTLRGWTMCSDRFLMVRSELTTAVFAALQKAGIEIPFPQRDLHVRSLDSELRKVFDGGQRKP